MTSRHISIDIDRPAAEVYDYIRNPADLPKWAAGLATSTVEQIEGQWIVQSPMGRAVVAFVPANPFGILDHDVTLPSGETVTNPMRVLADGDGCEVVMTVRQRDLTDEQFAADCAAVTADLHTLRRILTA